MTASNSIAIHRPPLGLLGTEPWRAACEFVTHTLKPREADPPVGDGHPIVIIPGLATDATAVAPLRRHCESLGYTALDWGRGFNRGPQGNLDQWLAELAKDMAELLRPYSRRATLIGWSLGGLYARELGKLMAPMLRQVITIGTPFNASADHTNVGWLMRLLGRDVPTIDTALSERLRTPPPLPTTSLYSRSDGIVTWQTCLHAEPTDQVQDIEIPGSHLGMGWNPAVFDVIADRLQQMPATWQPYPATP